MTSVSIIARRLLILEVISPTDFCAILASAFHRFAIVCIAGMQTDPYLPLVPDFQDSGQKGGLAGRGF